MNNLDKEIAHLYVENRRLRNILDQLGIPENIRIIPDSVKSWHSSSSWINIDDCFIDDNLDFIKIKSNMGVKFEYEEIVEDDEYLERALSETHK